MHAERERVVSMTIFQHCKKRRSGVLYLILVALLAVLSIFSATERGINQAIDGTVRRRPQDDDDKLTRFDAGTIQETHSIAQQRRHERRNMTGSWMGNTWIPPPTWHSFSVEEMQDLYKERNVLWFGDSTARRTAMTLYSVLNATTVPHVSYSMLERDIDVNKRVQSEDCERWKNTTGDDETFFYPQITICRKVHPNGGEVTLAPGSCVQHLEAFLEAEAKNGGAILSSYDVLCWSCLWEYGMM